MQGGVSGAELPTLLERYVSGEDNRVCSIAKSPSIVKTSKRVHKLSRKTEALLKHSNFFFGGYEVCRVATLVSRQTGGSVVTCFFQQSGERKDRREKKVGK